MPIPNSATSPFMKRARARYTLGDESTTDQRGRERDDLRFYAGEQWPPDIKQARQSQQPTNGLPSVPARPTLVINKVREPVRQIQNQERASDINIELVPADDFGDLGVTPDDTEITLREGLIRRIQRDSQAADARSWAFARAVQAGQGYYRVNTRYLPGKTWDQEICIERIFNQASVVLDPSHTQPDGSDAEWGFIGYDLTADRYKADFGTLPDGKDNGIAAAVAVDSEWRALGDDYPKWFLSEGKDGEKRSVRVLEYFYKEHTARELAILTSGDIVYMEDVPKGTLRLKDGESPPEGVLAIADVRTMTETVVKWAKIDGVQVLEETEWPGPDLPIIKVVGEELQPFDGERRIEGVVRNAVGSQQGFNYMISKMVETVGLTPIPALMLDPLAIDGYEAWYDAANTRTLPYLPYRTRDDQGLEMREPHRPPVDPNLQPMALSLQVFDGLIKSTTAVPDSTLGNVDPALKSGRAIREVVENAQNSTSNYLDNLGRSMRYEGQTINNLLYPIYGTRPGRLVRLVTGEGDKQAVRIAADEQQPGAPAPTQETRYALTKDANYNVAVKVGKSSLQRREQFVRMFGEILSAAPEQLLVAGDLLYKNMDIPEAKQLAKRMRVMLAPAVQKLLADEDSGADPAAQLAMAQAQLQQLQTQLQQAGELVQELHGKAEGKQLESDTKVRIAEMEQQRDIELEKMKQLAAVDQAQAEVEIQRMKDATAIRVAEIAAESKGLVSADAMVTQQIALDQGQQHDADMAVAQREHEARVAEQGQRFQADEADRNRQQEAELAASQTQGDDHGE